MKWLERERYNGWRWADDKLHCEITVDVYWLDDDFSFFSHFEELQWKIILKIIKHYTSMQLKVIFIVYNSLLHWDIKDTQYEKRNLQQQQNDNENNVDSFANCENNNTNHSMFIHIQWLRLLLLQFHISLARPNDSINSE